MSWRVRARTGETVFGATTYDQVDDYVRVCEHDNAALDTAIGNCKAWIAEDPQGFESFNERANIVSNELPPLVRAVQDARPKILGTKAINAETQAALDKLRTWRRELNDLYSEFQAYPHGCTVPPMTPEPQPTAEDEQLEAYKQAKRGTDVIEHAEQKVEEGAESVGRIALPIGAGIALAAVGVVTFAALARR